MVWTKLRLILDDALGKKKSWFLYPAFLCRIFSILLCCDFFCIFFSATFFWLSYSVGQHCWGNVFYHVQPNHVHLAQHSLPQLPVTLQVLRLSFFQCCYLRSVNRRCQGLTLGPSAMQTECCTTELWPLPFLFLDHECCEEFTQVIRFIVLMSFLAKDTREG